MILMKITTVNPATEERIEDFEVEERDEINKKVEAAKKAFEYWKDVDIKERSRLMRRLGRKMLSKDQKLAESITKEMGKPIKESIAEIEKCASICEYFGKNAKKMLKDDSVKTEFKKSYVRFEPLGVIGSIMPWNFPMSQVIRFSAPAIVAGNVQIAKPSSATPRSGGLAVEELFHAVKFPEGVFQAAIGDASTGATLMESRIDAASFTGSVEAGSKVGQLAVKGIRPIVLELGGSDPFIVLEDADMDQAVKGAVHGRFLNCGQSCIAAKRFIVLKDIDDVFTEKFIDATKSLKVGDPMDASTDIGPLVRDSARAALERQISESVKQGGKVLLGGKRLQGKGYFFEPTVMSATNGMAIAREEAFGPAAPIIAADTEEDAVRIANDTEFGLGASIWTTNIERGEMIAKKIRAGVTYVNKNVRSDPRLPFGGAKKSGIGRELSRYGLLEMTNIKSVIVN